MRRQGTGDRGQGTACFTRCTRDVQRRGGLALSAVSLAGGCVGTGAQDVLAPAGPQAERIADWFWTSFALAEPVFVAFVRVLGFVLLP